MVPELIMLRVRSVGIELDIRMKAARFTSSQLHDTLVPVPGMLPEGVFEETFTDGPPEADLNTQSLPADGLFVWKTDEEATESHTGNVPYTSCVRLTMELLLDFGNATVERSSTLVTPSGLTKY